MIKTVYNSLCALAFIHSAGIMHRDIKSANILISPSCNTKICDFGMARTVPTAKPGRQSFNSLSIRNQALSKYSGTKQRQKSSKVSDSIVETLNTSFKERKRKPRLLSVHVNTRWYRCPEVCLINRSYDQAQDMWGFGCTFYELLAFTFKD